MLTGRKSTKGSEEDEILNGDVYSMISTYMTANFWVSEVARADTMYQSPPPLLFSLPFPKKLTGSNRCTTKCRKSSGGLTKHKFQYRTHGEVDPGTTSQDTRNSYFVLPL